MISWDFIGRGGGEHFSQVHNYRNSGHHKFRLFKLVGKELKIVPGQCGGASQAASTGKALSVIRANPRSCT
jgi:hypothetical protein